MYTPILLALPFLAPALGHTIPRHAARGHHAHTVRVDTPVERSYPKAHFGIAPASSDLSGVAGFKRDGGDVEERSYPKAHFGLPPKDSDSITGAAGFKRDGKKLVRRRKRSCAVKPSSSSVSSAAASASASASSIGGDLSANPPSASSPAAEPTSTSIVWDDSTHGVPAATTASAVSSSAYEPSSTYSSAAAASSSATSDSGSSGLQGLMAFVFPRGKGSADWSTVVDEAGSLSFDGALKPLTAGKLPSAGQAPDGSNALVANYPANTVKLSAAGHGYSFYSAGAHDDVIVDGAKEVMFSYSVFFQDGFQFVKGGKLPGLYGGTSLDTAKSCSGGRQDGRDECFSARLMWRKDGAGEIYNYLPSAAYSNSNYCNYPPFSLCDAQYGESIGRGAFTFPTGQWTTVAIRLKLNDEGVANGEQELFVNGNSVISLTDLTIRVNADTKIYGIMAQTFFGGSDDSWASPIDQSAWFKDWSLAVLA